ncbi:hypothetical protein HanIR_Chr14g0719121 [Helianthus annuus]|nr:hypothetical protein HanIR_Chr14g0719121 [Helianthus annuus]
MRLCNRCCSWLKNVINEGYELQIGEIRVGGGSIKWKNRLIKSCMTTNKHTRSGSIKTTISFILRAVPKKNARNAAWFQFVF